MKTFKINFKEISKDRELRNDVKYNFFIKNYTWNIFNSKNKLIKLKNILINSYKNFIFEDEEEYYGIPTGQNYIDEDGYITDKQLITKEEHPNRIKYKIDSNNILISSLRLAKSPSLNFRNLDFNKYVFSNGFYIFNVDKSWNKIFILYLLRNKKIKLILDNYLYRGIGISAYKDYDLLNIKIPQIPLETQNKAAEQITPIENKIQELKAQIQDPKTIINEVFAEEFNFNINEFEEIKKIEKINKINFSNFSKNKDLRNSVKFNKKSYEYLINFLKLNNFKILKDIVEEPIVLGAGINQNDIDTDSNYYYISMAELKNFKLDISNCKKIKKDFFNSKIDKSIKYGDIIIARSGEGTIGKCAIINIEDVEGINADFTIKVRINEKKYNRNFAYLYFCSFYFQYMVEINKKGLGNNTNIFPTQIQNFLIPNIPLQKQQEIVDKIQTKINEQNKINDLIEKEREKINYIIENIVNL